MNISELVQSRVPGISAGISSSLPVPPPLSVILGNAKNSQPYFADAFCKNLIDTRLTQSIVEKTYHCFNSHFSDLENFRGKLIIFLLVLVSNL